MNFPSLESILLCFFVYIVQYTLLESQATISKSEKMHASVIRVYEASAQSLVPSHGVTRAHTARQLTRRVEMR